MSTPVHIQNAIYALLAALTGPNNRLMEMDGGIKPEHLPDDMPFAKKYLQVLWEIALHGGSPTKEAVLHGLSIRCPDVPDLPGQMDTLMQNRTEDTHVGSLSWFVKDYLNQQIANTGWDNAMRIINKPEGTLTERWAEAKQYIDEKLIQSHQQSRMSSQQVLESYLETLRMYRDRALSGLSVGPELPYESLKELVPILKPTEMMLLTAPTGTGKTTIAMDIAEHNAHKADVPVLYIALETDADRFQQRMIAKHLLIPINYQESGNIDPDQTPWKELFDTERQRLEQVEHEKSPLIWEFCAGAKNSDIERSIYMFSEVCKGMRKPGEVIIDYLQKMQMLPGKDERQSWSEDSEFVKTCAERYKVHITLLSQESESKDGRASSFGTNAPKHKAQLHISIVRDMDAKENLIVPGKGGGQAVDQRGNPRFYHKKGEVDSKAILRVEKQNNGPTGEGATRIENSFFRVVSVGFAKRYSAQ